MTEEKELKKHIRLYHLVVWLFSLSLIAGILLVFYTITPSLFDFKSKPDTIVSTPIETEIEEEDADRIENGIHVRTGLIEAEGFMAVVNNCTSCHSAKIITQNRMTTEGWNTTIKWMQETQNLWDLGDNQAIIVNYLVTNYPLTKKGRRENLKNIEWYELEN